MTTLALHPPAAPATGKRGPAFGLGLSLLVHAAVLAWLAQLPAPRTQDDAPVARMEIRLVPARPARPAAPEAKDAPAEPSAIHAAAPRQPAVRRHAPADASAPARASETPALITAPSNSAPDAFAVPQPAADPAAGPVVDLAAARQAARAIAREDGKGLVALPKRKLVVDPNADKPDAIDPIEAARRPDCKSAYAGAGLLAVIPLIKDAVTGTGCKW